MKKLFAEPEIEILNFLCNDIVGADSYSTGSEGEGVGGGDGGDAVLPLP